MAKEKLEVYCDGCGRPISATDLQGLLLGVCSGDCARRAGIGSEEWTVLAAAFDRLHPHWKRYERLLRILS